MRAHMRADFIKMHGLGNDFIVLDDRGGRLPALTPALVQRLCDRREGIGCDQLVHLGPSTRGDVRMRIYNQDGSTAGACGNASRAVAMLLGQDCVIESDDRLLAAELCGGGASIDMGAPSFSWDAIPLAYPMPTERMPVAWDDLSEPDVVNVGNPHAVFFVDDTDKVPLDLLGPRIESDPLFPDRININIAMAESPTRLRLRVWERGAGLTRACGTGACASAVAAIRRGLVRSPVTVALPGGELEIAWTPGGTIRMSGAATESFRGSFAWEDYA